MKHLELVWILWPSFLVAALANALFFAVFDPQDLIAFGEPVSAGRMAVYSTGFFAFWLVTAASAALSRFFQKTSTQINP